MISHLDHADYKAFIGLDWANDKHDVCVQDGSTGTREFAVIKHNIKEIESWAKGLYQRFGGQIAIAVELSKGPIIYALQHFSFFTIVPINPTTLAKYRTTFKSSGAKDDPTDAEFALELMLRYPERFKPLELQSILRWPTCQQAKRVRIPTFRKFFHEHEVYKQASIERRISIIQNTIPLTDDEAVVETHSALAIIYAKRIMQNVFLKQ